jgi:hypothetical protein
MTTTLEKLFGRLLKGYSESDSRDINLSQGPADLKGISRTMEGISSKVVWLDGKGVRSSKSVTIRDVSSEGISFSCHEKFLVHQTVWIETGKEMTKAVVRHCQPRGRLYLIGAQMVGAERRREERSPVSGEAMLSWEHPDGGFCHAAVRVHNASDSGVQLQSSVPVAIGTAVKLIGPRLQCYGSTCYCQESEDQFLIGVQVTTAL